MSAVLLLLTQIKLHSTSACVLTPHDIASHEGHGTACVCVTQYAICCGGAGPRSVGRSVGPWPRSADTVGLLPLSPGHTCDAWESSRKQWSGSVTKSIGPSSAQRRLFDEETYAGHRTSPHVVTFSLSLCLSSMPSEALKHRASLTSKSGFLSFFLLGPKLIFKVSFAANFSVLNYYCISVILLLSRN